MVEPKLLRHWVLTNTRDDGIMTYRPKKAKTGTEQETEADGFELKKDGTIIEYRGSQSSQPYSYTGKYEIVGDTIRTYFKAHYFDAILKIVKLDDDLLEIV